MTHLCPDNVIFSTFKKEICPEMSEMIRNCKKHRCDFYTRNAFYNYCKDDCVGEHRISGKFQFVSVLPKIRPNFSEMTISTRNDYFDPKITIETQKMTILTQK